MGRAGQGSLLELDHPRDLTSYEAELVSRVLELAHAAPALRAQVADMEVWQRCDCGCRSVGLRVREGAAIAKDSTYRAITCVARGNDQRDVQVTLHVVEGEAIELEIWTGELGEVAEPEGGDLRYDQTFVRNPA
jgi:hypothetical protein